MGHFIKGEEGYFAVLAKEVNFITALHNYGCNRQKIAVFQFGYYSIIPKLWDIDVLMMI